MQPNKRMSETGATGQRSRMSSARNSSSNGSKVPTSNTIESSVTRLLVSTKHLLESLTQWARQEADDKFVSDAYVKLGNDFRSAARAFMAAGVDISDLGDVPRALRIVLESALSEAPTQENLDRFLPNIRNIVVNLLLNLKSKQMAAKNLASERQARGSSESLSDTAKQDLSSPSRKRIDPEQVARHSADSQDRRDSESVSSRHSEALAQLQKGNVILRRASKRYSAYQFAKLANFSGNQLPNINSDSFLSQSPQSTPSKVSSPNNNRIKYPIGASNIPDTQPKVQEPKLDTQSDLKTFDSVQQPEYIFLRLKNSTKKVLTKLPTTLASIRLLFVEKFAYSPRSESFPEIYISDPLTNISYELEEGSIGTEIQNGSLLILNVLEEEIQDQKPVPKQNTDDFTQFLESYKAKMTSEIKNIVSDFETRIPSILSSSVTIPSAATSESSPETKSKPNNRAFSKSMIDIKLELNAISQIATSRNTHFKDSLQEIIEDVSLLKKNCLEEGAGSSNRVYMKHSYTRLSEESDVLLTKVDDLQDMMEALRKDVAQRGVRLGQKQLKSTFKEIQEAKNLLKSLSTYIDEGKPSWKKIWEAELDKVCEEQQFFNLQDDLTKDLDEDIKKLEETFDLLEKCSMEQSKQTMRKTPNASRIAFGDPNENLDDLRDALLTQVSSLVPDHEGRLDAIKKAEKAREKERMVPDLTQFQEELGGFVDDQRLRRSGRN